MSEQDKNSFEPGMIDDATIQAMIYAAQQGVSVARLSGMPPETLEGLYALGYNLYNAGNHKDAETVFRGLCLYDHNDSRYWMGLAGSLQAQGEYKQAIDAYSMAGIATAMNDPQPFLFGAVCYLKMNDRENARGALLGIIDICGDDPAKVSCMAKAREMLSMLDGAAKN